MKIFYWVVLIWMILAVIGCHNDLENKEPESEHLCNVEPSAKFPGGIDGLNKFYQDNLRWPSPEFCGEGVEIIKFTVDEKGNISELEIKRSLCKKCDEEAIRVINLMPNWIPATKNGKPISCSMILPIRFKIE